MFVFPRNDPKKKSHETVTNREIFEKSVGKNIKFSSVAKRRVREV